MRVNWRIGVVLIGAALLLAVIFTAGDRRAHAVSQQLETEHSIEVGGVERTYRIYVPDDVRRSGTGSASQDDREHGSEPVPLLLAFHGGGSDSKRMAGYSGFDELADRNRFIVVYPQGLERNWHGMREGGQPAEDAEGQEEDAGGDAEAEDEPGPESKAEPGLESKSESGPESGAESGANPIDDVAFVRALIDHLKAEYPIDPQRIYAVGMSAGGIFSYHLACKMSDTFAAIAVVSGTMATADCDPTSPVAVLHIHARDDENVPFEGGRGRLTGRGNSWPPVAHGLDFWRRENGCEQDPRETETGEHSACFTNTQCASHKPVEYCLVDGGHQWPGLQRRALWQIVTGTDVTRTFPASERIWSFLRGISK